MTLDELATRLESASDDLLEMRSDLTAEAELDPPAPGPGVAIAAILNAAWSGQQRRMGRVAVELTQMALDVRAAADSYAAADEEQRWTR